MFRDVIRDAERRMKYLQLTHFTLVQSKNFSFFQPTIIELHAIDVENYAKLQN